MHNYDKLAILLVILGVILLLPKGFFKRVKLPKLPKPPKAQKPVAASKTTGDILTAKLAAELLSDTAVPFAGPLNNMKIEGDITVSQTGYSVNEKQTGTNNVIEARILQLTARMANAQNVAINQKNFQANGASATPVDGYGDAAYWDSNLGQLNIFKGSNWYLLDYGPAKGPLRKLDDTRIFADKIIRQLG